MSVYLQCQETCTHALKLKYWAMFLAIYGKKMLDVKNGYFGGRGNIKSIMLLWLPIYRC